MSQEKLFITIPAWNEEAGIVKTLDALREQTDTDFNVVIVDNNSTDFTYAIVSDYIDKYNLSRWEVIEEPQRGTGAASDTGMRYSISHGATQLLRTDADCIPVPEWVAEMKKEFARGTELVAGKCGPRVDETHRSQFKIKALEVVVSIAELYGKLRFSNTGGQYKTPFVMLSGCNVGITSHTYEAAGGFKRTRIEDLHEDRELMNDVRKVTEKIVFSKKAFIYMSTRRVDAWGIINTLRWYRNHGYKTDNANIR
jgi:glycosyltransferase involved in cell wall biosynthesis